MSSQAIATSKYFLSEDGDLLVWWVWFQESISKEKIKLSGFTCLGTHLWGSKGQKQCKMMSIIIDLLHSRDRFR